MAARRFVKDGVCRCWKGNIIRDQDFSDTCTGKLLVVGPFISERMCLLQMKGFNMIQCLVHQHGLKSDSSDNSWCWATSNKLQPVLAMRSTT